MGPLLVGQKLVAIRRMTRSELDREGWTNTYKTATALVFGNGTVIYASRDDEGNGPGMLFGLDGDGTGFYVSRLEGET